MRSLELRTQVRRAASSSWSHDAKVIDEDTRILEFLNLVHLRRRHDEMCSIPGPSHLLRNGVDGVYFPACLNNVTHAAASRQRQHEPAAPLTCGSAQRGVLRCGGRGDRCFGSRCGAAADGSDRTLMQYTYHYFCQANGDTRVHIEQRPDHSLNTPRVPSTKARVHITRGRHYGTYAPHAQTTNKRL